MNDKKALAPWWQQIEKWRARPCMFDAKCEIGMKDDELAITDSGAASRATAENTSCFVWRSSGVHSWT